MIARTGSPGLKRILTQAGGFLSYAAHRFASSAGLCPGNAPEGFLAA
ncbi:hypothetical protein JYK04_00216 [Streptomyces nojiriensis]|nr:hypothetical protein JYK04_00216 [Streptomyces nojiriensis]